MSGIEETVVLQDTKDYLSEKERAMYLLKKSYPSQKMFFAAHLDCYVKNEKKLLKTILQIIIEHLDLWDSNLCIAFSESLSSIIIEIVKLKGDKKDLDNDSKEIFSIVMSHYIKAITTMEKTVSDEYLATFSKCIDTLSNNPLYKIKPNNEIIQIVLDMGNFGQTPYNIKYAIYFITSLIRISSEYQENLLECFTSLIDEKGKEIKYEIAYDLKYIINQIDIGYLKSYYYSVIKSYLNESDIILRELILQTLFIHIGICDISMQKLIYITLDEIFSCEDSYTLSKEFNHFINIFIAMIDYFDSSILSGKVSKIIDFQSLIVSYLNKFLINNERKSERNDSFDLHSIEGDPYPINYLFPIFDKIARGLLYSNNLLFLNSCFISLLSQVNRSNEADFCNNIDHVLKMMGSDVLTPQRLSKICAFLITREELEPYDNRRNSSNRYKIPFNYEKFPCVMDIMRINDNEAFFHKLFVNTSQINTIINALSNDWRSQLSIFNSFSTSVLFYLIENHQRYPYTTWFKELFDIVKNLIVIDNVNYLLLMELSRLMAKLFKYSMNRNDIMQFINKEIFNNQSFYKRRLGCPFIETCYSIMSQEMFEENKLGDKVITMLEDKIKIIKCWALRFVSNNNFQGDWVNEFNQRVMTINSQNGSEDDDDDEDNEFTKDINLFIKEGGSKSSIFDIEVNSIRKEEEKKIREIEHILEETTQKTSDKLKEIKKSVTFKKINNSNKLTLSSQNANNSKLKKQLQIKAADDQLTKSIITPKKSLRSSVTLCSNFVNKKIGKAPLFEKSFRHSSRQNTFGNNKNP